MVESSQIMDMAAQKAFQSIKIKLTFHIQRSLTQA